MKRVLTIGLTMIIGLSMFGCNQPETIDKSKLNNEGISVSKVYTPEEDGIFVDGKITAVDLENNIINITNDNGDYILNLKEEVNVVFKELDELSVDDVISVRADYVEEGTFDLNVFEIQYESASDIEVNELKSNND